MRPTLVVLDELIRVVGDPGLRNVLRDAFTPAVRRVILTSTRLVIPEADSPFLCLSQTPAGKHEAVLDHKYFGLDAEAPSVIAGRAMIVGGSVVSGDQIINNYNYPL